MQPMSSSPHPLGIREAIMRSGSKFFLPAIILLASASPAMGQRSSHQVVPPAPVRMLSPRPATARLPITPMFRRIPVTGVSSTSVSNGNSSTSGPNVVFLDGSSDNLNQFLGLTPSL